MRKLTFHLFLALALVGLLIVLASPKPAQAQAGTAYDLIAAVNAYRSANDLAAYGVDSTLMSLAQAQSNYQASIGTCTHQRADSSGPGDHGISAENVACGADLSVNEAIDDQWSGSVHSATILGPITGLVGAGVAVASGSVYYTLDVKLLSGDFSYRPPKSASDQVNALAAVVTDTPNGQPALASAVITSTTNPNGSVIHIIQFGETLIQIAQAYGVTLAQIYAANPSLDPQNPVYYAGDALVIVPPFTSTPILSPTLTPKPPTHTPRPTYTTTRAPTATHPITPPATPPQGPIEGSDKSPGYGNFLVCGIGLFLGVILGFLKE